jgi:hypothetical protein
MDARRKWEKGRKFFRNKVLNRICNTYCSSTATMVKLTRLNIYAIRVCTLLLMLQVGSVRSPNEHAVIICLWIVHKTDMFSRLGAVSPSPNPQAGGPPLAGCPRMLIQYNHPPYCRPFLHPQPEDAPCRGDRDLLITLGKDWIELARDIDRWWALVNAVMKLRGSIKCGERLD